MSKRDSYQIWCIGICNVDITTPSQPGAVLMGGGTDTNEAFAWQIEHAQGGDFVVLRASGDDAYNPYIYEMSVAIGHPLHSVTTILFNNEKASKEDVVLTTIQNAEALFFAGGDQSLYVDYWMNTDVQTIIQSKLSTVTVGGTSAGLAILGNWIYTGEVNSITSEEALANPYHRYITITDKFLTIPYLDSIITDTHFVTRDRMGRMLTFVARIYEDYVHEDVVRAVGVDEHTALLLDVNTGDVEAVGVGTAYICATEKKAAVCEEKTPLTFTDIQCTRLNAKNGDSYSFATFKGGNDAVDYQNDIVSGKFTGFPYGPQA